MKSTNPVLQRAAAVRKLGTQLSFERWNLNMAIIVAQRELKISQLCEVLNRAAKVIEVRTEMQKILDSGLPEAR